MAASVRVRIRVRIGVRIRVGIRARVLGGLAAMAGRAALTCQRLGGLVREERREQLGLAAEHARDGGRSDADALELRERGRERAHRVDRVVCRQRLRLDLLERTAAQAEADQGGPQADDPCWLGDERRRVHGTATRDAEHMDDEQHHLAQPGCSSWRRQRNARSST